ncbi:hypothetical protein Syun_024520 [Stephania yunnanensis]|uniref:Uncharacterized protein n=1 Tax=Stephania yunnanensis TaxID=152371 RepID=A0AAP0I4K0_9MAGN
MNGGGSSRKSANFSTSSKKKLQENGSSDVGRRTMTPRSTTGVITGERTVKRLRLSKALTIPESTCIYDACRRMAARRVDALLLTDSNALLCGILTDKDIATRVIAQEVNLEETPVSKVMTRNPVFVLSDTLAVEALQKMVQGKFRHLPVVENGEVIALLDIAKCLYDAIARMERAAEKGKAIAAAVEGVEKHWGTSISGWLRVMTPNPECATVDTPIVDALHTMHDGKFLHLPVVDRDGTVVSVVDVIHITHAAVATVGNSGVGNEAASTMMQKFWDSALTLGPLSDDDETRSEGSLKLASEGTDTGRSLSYPSSSLPHTFGFKIQDNKGRMHRFNCDTRSLTELITSILQRVGDDIDQNRLPQIMYEDEDHDKVMLASDGDLAAAVDHARQAGWKGLRLHLDYSRPGDRHSGGSLDYAQRDAWAAAYSTVAAGAALIAGLGVLAYLKRSSS